MTKRRTKAQSDKGRTKRRGHTPDRQAREWMNLADATRDIQNGIALPFSTLRETVTRAT